MRYIHLTLIWLALAVSVLPVKAGPLLDEALNIPTVDQANPADGTEGLVAIARKQADWIVLTRDQPVAQTIRLSADSVFLARIFLGLCHWPDSWHEGENVTVSLFETNPKGRLIYKKTIPYSQRSFKWDVAIDVYKDVKPGSIIYVQVELTGAGDGKLNISKTDGNQYKAGMAYTGDAPLPDTDLTFAVTTRPSPDRQANLEKFYNRFDWSHPYLAEAAIARKSGNEEKTLDLLLAAFHKLMEEAKWAPKPPAKGTRNTETVDRVVEESRYYSKDERRQGQWIPMDRTTTWREVWPGSPDYIRHNDLFRDLGFAYASTGDEKYAAKLNQLMFDQIVDNTSPFDGGMRGGRWVAMFAAWRLGDAFDGFVVAKDAKSFTRDVQLAWLDHQSRMADFAMQEPTAGNHANAVAEAVMQFGTKFPLYASSKGWKDFAFNLLVNNSADLFYADGACKEPTMNYHGFSLSNLLLGIETSQKNGYEIPAHTLETTEKALAFTAYMLLPNGLIPSNGDTNTPDLNPAKTAHDAWRKGEAARGFAMFGRKDLQYISTAGKEGERPQQNSYRFPVSGYTVLRRDWGGVNGKDFEQSPYLLHHGHTYGSHGHDDLNQIVLYAYGRQLIFDPGRTKYGTPEMVELIRNRSHNVLLVDDQPMRRVEPKFNRFHTNTVADVIDVTYPGLYSGIDHRRAVVYVRPGFFVMFDDVHQASQGNEKTFTLNFWLAPEKITWDPSSPRIVSVEAGFANILLQATGSGDVSLSRRDGQMDVGSEKYKTDVNVMMFSSKSSSSARFATLLMPLKPGQAGDGIHIIRDAASENEPGSAQTVKVTHPDGITFVSQGGESAFTVVNASASGDVKSFSLFEGNRLTNAGKVLLESTGAIANLSVIYTADAVVVETDAESGSIKIAALGRTKAIVNGRAQSVDGATFNVF